MKNNRMYNIELLTVLFSCDRSIFLNKTISSFYYHMQYYEPKIKFSFYFVDSGTSDRLNYIEKYNIKNIFFMNPNHYIYAYKMFWTYLHGEFVLFLEDDRPFIRRIENSIIYSNFLEEAILILKINKVVKGITFKNDYPGNITFKNIKTYLGIHILCIVKQPVGNYFYVNGPSIYNIKDLLQVNNFISESDVAFNFMNFKWYTGFTFKGIKCQDKNTFTSACQGISKHLGKGYSTYAGKSICKNYMY